MKSNSRICVGNVLTNPDGGTFYAKSLAGTQSRGRKWRSPSVAQNCLPGAGFDDHGVGDHCDDVRMK